MQVRLALVLSVDPPLPCNFTASSIQEGKNPVLSSWHSHAGHHGLALMCSINAVEGSDSQRPIYQHWTLTERTALTEITSLSP